MSMTIPKPPHSVIALALGRSTKDFSERDRLLLDLLRPHLAQAHDSAATLARLRREPAEPMLAKHPRLSRESLGLLGLTDREMDILLGIARGRANKQIAARLYVSPFTVKTHLQHVYRKLAVRSRTEALSRVLELLDRPE
jgi:DNA-binding NarL/FixJ family response regulator